MIELGEEADAYLALKKKSTRTTYQNQLRRFLRWYKSKYGEDKGFDHLLDQMDKNQKLPRRDRKHVAETIMVEYIDFLKDEEGLANHTIRTGFTALQNFLKSMNYEMSGIWIGNLPSATSRKENSKQRWTIEQISEFVEKAPSYRDKAAILVMFQSGMAVNELMSLDYGDIEAQLKSGNLPILIDMTRKKTGVEYRTCIGADAVNYLKTYLKTRKNLKSKSPLFTKIGSEKRLTRVTLQGRFREIADELSFVTLKKDSMNPARPHSMRSAFRSRLTNRAAETFIEYLMGHKLNGTESAYLNMPNEALVKDYLEIEKYLSIETTSKDILAGRPSEGEQSHILRAYQEQMGDLQNKNDALSKMVDSLAKKSEEQERLLQMVVDRLVWLEGEEKDMPEDAHMMTAAEKEKYGKISNF